MKNQKRIDAIARVIGLQNEAHLLGEKRLDAGEVVGFARLLENVESTVFSTMYQDTRYRNLFGLVGGYAEQEFHTYRSYVKAGEAKIIHDHASDYPRVTIAANPEDKQPTRTIGASYEYTVRQLRQALRNGMALETELAVLARESIERAADKITAFGSSADGIPGFVANQTVAPTAVTATTKNGGGTLWSTYTGGAAGAQASEIALDVTKLVKACLDSTNNTFGDNAPVVLAFGTKAMNFSRFTYLSGANFPPMYPFMELFRKVPNLSRIEWWPQLNTAGAGNTERLMAWIDDPRVAGLSIPQEIQASAPEARNKAFVVNLDMRFSGCIVRHPKAIAYMDSTQP